MKPTESTATRDKERTRRAIIDAASQMIYSHGANVSLADIASAAGVSKGALTHHFTSRSALEEAILVDVSQRLWDVVHERLDFSEDRPGKLLRAYIRALTDDDAAVRDVVSPGSLLLIIGGGQPGQEALKADAGKWRKAFDADGIDPALSLTIRYAAEGLAASIGTPYLTPAELRSARTRLLAMAEPA
ncbi:TetR/AcrR family transcriptional regulator [Arthrobacter sp. zg-Y1171]|uniref:TetR/AcrR family transcriptional regulator n=1 Tax=Arthrobacter sp. zg-Y1171 TaxID=2964610 RepID=UPI0021043793|nr:TetR family transcriptional regulator [Arthrobacter sp. zg-Y1171]MCQ1995794.1 TetR family transcriptional regulator [Arthrobacter sp. zg-Y1171]UWX83125.1 TetR family transcriptional regulator [Arthrobacter sp. zg-Y1171]